MTGQDDHGAVREGGHLRRLLLDAGVSREGGKWSLHELAERSGLGYGTWQRLVSHPQPAGKHGPRRFRDSVLRVVAETLRTAGAKITYEQIKHAASADAGDVGYETLVSGDDPVEVALSFARKLSPADRMVFLQEFFAMAAEDGGVPAPPRGAHDQEDGVPDDRQNPHPQPG